MWHISKTVSQHLLSLQGSPGEEACLSKLALCNGTEKRKLVSVKSSSWDLSVLVGSQ